MSKFKSIKVKRTENNSHKNGINRKVDPSDLAMWNKMTEQLSGLL